MRGVESYSSTGRLPPPPRPNAPNPPTPTPHTHTYNHLIAIKGCQMKHVITLMSCELCACLLPRYLIRIAHYEQRWTFARSLQGLYPTTQWTMKLINFTLLSLELLVDRSGMFRAQYGHKVTIWECLVDRGDILVVQLRQRHHAWEQVRMSCWQRCDVKAQYQQIAQRAKRWVLKKTSLDLKWTALFSRAMDQLHHSKYLWIKGFTSNNLGVKLGQTPVWITNRVV